MNQDLIVSAVVLSYNRCREVLITINKLKAMRSDLPFQLEIIVVDNASADDTTEQVLAKHPDIILITKPVNNGIAGWNEGFQTAVGKYMLVLDDDSHVHTGLAEAVTRLEEDAGIGILALQIVDEDIRTDPAVAAGEGWQDRQKIAGFIGCGALIRRTVYQKIGGFAEWIYVYTHEFEYAIRCLDAGYRIVFCSACLVVHRVSKTNRSNKRLRIFATRNELLIIHKYFATGRTKYLKRVLVNNLKFVKREGVLAGYYIMQGLYKYFQVKGKVGFTPVSTKTQAFFAPNFWSTKPIFNKKNK